MYQCLGLLAEKLEQAKRLDLVPLQIGHPLHRLLHVARFRENSTNARTYAKALEREYGRQYYFSRMMQA
jgi:hypothetical protein